MVFAEAALTALVHNGGMFLPTVPTFKAIWTLPCVTHNVVTHASLDVPLCCFLEPHDPEKLLRHQPNATEHINTHSQAVTARLATHQALRHRSMGNEGALLEATA